MTTVKSLKSALKACLKDDPFTVKRSGGIIYVTYNKGDLYRLNSLALSLGFNLYGEAPVHFKTAYVKFEQISKGHLCWKDGYELYVHEGDVYKAPYSNVIDINSGYRLGRWECTLAHYQSHLAA